MVRPASRTGRCSRFASIEILESRHLLATFIVTSNADSGPGTLRDAITQVNGDKTAGVDTIDFNIGSGGLQTIALNTALPAISHSLLIDGSSQPGASTTPRIELNGSNTTSDNGLSLSGSNITIQDLAIDGFTEGAGVGMAGDGGDAVLGCFLGTNPTGTTASPNAYGVGISSANDTIGGTTALDRNVISGNLTANVLIGGYAASYDTSGFDFTGAVVEGNLIGTDATGNAALRGVVKGGAGIYLYYNLESLIPPGSQLRGPSPTIGGMVAGAGNVIAGNPGDGILDDSISGLVAQGNRIGVGIIGGAVGNGGNGIAFANDADGCAVGGTAVGQGNIIANNAGVGVNLVSPYDHIPYGDSIRGNSIFNNPGGAIAFMGVPRTPTGPSPTPGPNFFQAHPVITSAVTSNGSVTITGTLDDSARITSFNLDFYASKPTNPVLAFGEAQTYLGSTALISDVNGHASFTVTLPDAAYAPGDLFTATATDPYGDTSEVSDDFPNVETPALADLAITGSASPASIYAGQQVTVTYNITNNGPIADQNVRLALNSSFSLFELISATVGTVNTEPFDQNGVAEYYIGNIGVGKSATLTIVYQSNNSNSGLISSSVTLIGGFPDPNPANNSTTTTVNVSPPPAPMLTVTQSATPNPATPSTPVAFTVTVTNAGTLPATGVVVADTVPPGITTYATSQGTDILDNGVLTATLGTIAVGASATITFTAVPATGSATITNGGTITSTNETFTNNGQFTTSVPITGGSVPPPTLAVTTSATPDPATPGAPLTFTVTVANTGTTDAPNVGLIDTLPLGFQSSTITQGGAEQTGETLDASFGTIPAGHSATLTLLYIATGTTPLVNAGSVFAVTTSNIVGQYSLTVPVAGPPPPTTSLTISTTATPNPVAPGSPLGFTVTVTNSGTADALNVGLDDDLPGNLLGYFVTQGQDLATPGVVSAAFGTIHPGQSASLTVVVTASGSGSVVNTGTVISSNDPTLNGQFATTVSVVSPSKKPVPADYQGTGTSDLALYLPSIGAFAIRPSTGGPDQIIPFGIAGAGQSIPVSADFTGDGKTDLAVYMPSIGAFGIRPSSGGPDQIVPFGIPGAGQSLPAVGDYSGTGTPDIAVYLPSIGAFAIRPHGGGADIITPFGIAGAGQSIPAPGDYDGDGKTDLAVYLPSIGAFAFRPSSGGPDQIIPFGAAGAGQSIPMPGDYDGSGRTELAVYLPAYGLFAYRPAHGGPDVLEPFGIAGAGQSIPTPGEYTGANRTDLALYLPSIGAFAIRPATGGADQITLFGIPGNGQSIPVTASDPSTPTTGVPVAAASVPVHAEAVVVGRAVPAGVAKRKPLVAQAESKRQ